jgi:hypothetical protein
MTALESFNGELHIVGKIEIDGEIRRRRECTERDRPKKSSNQEIEAPTLEKS